MKIWQMLVLALALLIGLISLSLISDHVSPNAVGFQWSEVPDPDDTPIEIAIWYPSNDRMKVSQFGLALQRVAMDGTIPDKQYPLIVISHGTGGSLYNSYDTAIALADSGFIVASLTHTGDNIRDKKYSFTQRNQIERTRHISRVIDFMLDEWTGRQSVDPTRIGIFGHSSGGLTALLSTGGVADWKRVGLFCEKNPMDWGCLRAQQHNSAKDLNPGHSTLIHGPDDRIKAAVVVTPALAHAFSIEGLSAIAVPIQLWVGGKDEIVTTANLLPSLFSKPVDYHFVEGAGHFSFFAPCNFVISVVAHLICKDADGFDRREFHAEFNASVRSFFQEHLAP